MATQSTTKDPTTGVATGVTGSYNPTTTALTLNIPDNTGVNSPITNSSLQTNPSINLNGTIPPPAPAPTVPPPLPIADAPIQTTNNDLTNQLMEGLGLTAGKAVDTLNIQNDAQVQATAAEKKRLSDLYNTQAAEYNKAVSFAEANAGGVTTSTLYGQQAAINRNKASNLESINAQYQIASGNYDEALKSAQRIVDLKYAPIEEKNTIMTNQLAAIKDIVTKADKKQYDAQVLANEKEKQAIADNKEKEKDISSILMKAIEGGATPQQQLAIKNSKTVNDALTAAGSSIKKPTTDIVKLDNGNTILIDKVSGKIIHNYGGGTSGGSNANVPSLFNGLISTVSAFGSTDKQRNAIKGDLSNFISNQDFTGAYNYVANNVENSLTGTTKTEFANARIVYETLEGLKGAINKYKAAGGDTGLLIGTSEEIERKLGQKKFTDPKLTELAVQLKQEFFNYRVNMTGAAFSQPESRDYASVMPSTKNNYSLNLAIIEGGQNMAKNRIDSTIRAKVPQATDLLKVNNVKDKDYQSMETDFKETSKTSVTDKLNNLIGI